MKSPVWSQIIFRPLAKALNKEDPLALHFFSCRGLIVRGVKYVDIEGDLSYVLT